MGALDSVGRNARKVAILIVGVTVVLAGVALLALPGPGMLVIIVGLLILSTEFEWAQRWLDYAVEKTAGATTKVQESRSGRILLALSGLALMAVGIAIIVFFSQWIVAGISLILAGIIGLCTLLPQVQDWIAEKALTGIDGVDNVD
ncbi:MAG: PGPGW domain-containing protein [Ilumatobacter sp.]